MLNFLNQFCTYWGICYDQLKQILQIWTLLNSEASIIIKWFNFALLQSRTRAITKWDDDDDEFFLWYGWPMKGVKSYFQSRSLSEILTISNLWHTTSRIWTCAEPEFRLWWMKLCSSDIHCTTVTESGNS